MLFSRANRGSRDKHKFHSRECAFAYQRLNSLKRLEGIQQAREAKRQAKMALAARPKPLCIVCRTAYTLTHTSKYCSSVCRGAGMCAPNRKGYQRDCLSCDAPFKASRVDVLKCHTCSKRASKRKTRKARRLRLGHDGHHTARARIKGLPRDYSVTPLRVFDRDGWRCRLCGRATPKRLQGKQQPLSPTVDHIIPFALGGGHTWDNVQLACHECNMAKGATVKGQLRLAV